MKPFPFPAAEWRSFAVDRGKSAARNVSDRPGSYAIGKSPAKGPGHATSRFATVAPIARRAEKIFALSMQPNGSIEENRIMTNKRDEWNDEKLIDMLCGGWPGLDKALSNWSLVDGVTVSAIRLIIANSHRRLTELLALEKLVARRLNERANWISPEAHDKRVSELIAANNRELERRRNMRKFVDSVLESELSPADFQFIKAAARDTIERDRELSK